MSGDRRSDEAPGVEPGDAHVDEPRGPLAGLRALELADEKGAFAGKLLADMGADVVLVEPPAGARARAYEPFAGDLPGHERSLWWWHYNTSKRGVTLDIDSPRGCALFRDLARTADLVIECEPPGRLAALGLDYPDLSADNPRLVMLSITPYGRGGAVAAGDAAAAARDAALATDLTLLAGGGPVWMCGYDDHTLPPVRGGGNQGYQIACHFAVMSAMVALVARQRTGRGQHVDVNMHAAASVTNEAGNFFWLVAQRTVQRQTGRHASVDLTQPSQVRAADGRYVNTGIPPRTPTQFRAVRDWLADLGLLEEFPLTALLEEAIAGGAIPIRSLVDDEYARAKFGAGRDAVNFIAERLPAYDFFIGGQERDLQFGIIYSPEEVMGDPHFQARGFPVEVAHPELGISFRYPGAPYRFGATPWRIRRRAPLLGEDNAAVYAGLGLGSADLETLRRDGVV